MRKLTFLLFCASVFISITLGYSQELVDIYADEIRPVRITEDSTATFLRGNVVFYHNGAIITCDSAVRYSEKYMQCFKRVVINKDNTYVYGERADYNGTENLASVYGPVIKMVDGDATFYTFEFTFNTKSSIGRFSRRGTMSQKDNLLESQRGYYYTKTRDFICVDNVQLKNLDYKIVSDSVGYNLDSEIATFFTKTTIWNSKGEILNATSGTYDQKSSDYRFTSNAYVLSSDKEVWSDTLNYNSISQDAQMYSNIQINDTQHKVMAFGDKGLYWGKEQNAQLTSRPSIISYDPQQPADSLYMRSDSLFLYTVPRESIMAEQAAALSNEAQEGERERGHHLRDTTSLINPIDSIDSINSINLIDSTDSKRDSLIRVIRAYRDVKIFRNDFQVVCDSMYANSLDSILHMRINPIMWNGKSQIKSDIVDVYTKNQQIQKAVFIGGDPIMSSEADSIRYNQVKGKEIISFFVDNEMTKTDVVGNGQTLYFTTDEKTGDVQGLWFVECADMTFAMVQREITTITWRANPVYALYPIDKVPEDVALSLPGFVWEVERRPKLKDVFDREIRPSERAHYESLPQPQFPITESVKVAIESLIRADVWRDRNDRITDFTWDVIRSFGYEITTPAQAQAPTPAPAPQF